MCGNQERSDEFKLKKLNIQNPDYTFYEALKNDKSFFDEFVKEIRQAADKTSLAAIFNLMARLRKSSMLPYKLFHRIGPNNKGDREDIYEFKKNNLRVYVALLPNDVVVLLGGFKKNQDGDIEKVFRHFNQFKVRQDGTD